MSERPDDDVRHDHEQEQAAARRSSGIAQEGDVPDPPSEPETGAGAGSPVAGREIDPDTASEARERSAATGE
jgi:hypothetical protein